ncbi:acyl-CoA oxidase [Aspergillus sclerotioniger CBS 115572]|uniref:Acyl-CoA oxidase n=1 Tax=Aspergillus sclerotioniger CBS 115572 TaxID=1450535 RepID=A0A317WF74_9EURO|nr:acyl-CoA oxidase [Aspergillus sclerotioniger CBS 115572]PWY83648.1 acyl-CoA oxidase [Aspergillus sclerotioniger CBS 115572]
MQSSTVDLLSSDLFKHHYEAEPREAHLERSYHRARAMARYWRLTVDDIIHFTPKFRHAHTDGIILRDTVAQTIFSIHYNLIAGTIAFYLPKRPDLKPLMNEIMQFDVVGSYMLTEVGHGCDARNIETVATRQPDGSFVLDTPNSAARKFMPPSAPVAGIPRIALVFARLLIDGEDRGIGPFIVPINNGQQMQRGIKAWRLPDTGSGRVLNHDLTSFDHVYLPPTALLGDFTKPINMRDQYLASIHRLSIGALIIGLWVIPFLKGAAFIVGKYSQRRTVQEGLHGPSVPIISFRTQQLPIAHALAEAAVLEPFADWTIEQHKSPSTSPGAKHALSVIFKVVALQNGRESLNHLIERSGARGMFPDNGLLQTEVFVATAEGEVLVLSIRSATELLLGRYKVPEAKMPGSLLERHEAGFIAELKKLLKEFKQHRSTEYNHYILPRCRSMLLAIGQRMVYEAANDRGVDPDLLALYEAGAVKSDSSWYVEQMGLSRAAQYDMERQACDNVVSQLDRHLDGLGIEPYCPAPMLSSSNWDAFVDASPLFAGDSVPSRNRREAKL